MPSLVTRLFRLVSLGPQVVFETNLGTCLDTVIGGIDPLFMAKGARS